MIDQMILGTNFSRMLRVNEAAKIDSLVKTRFEEAPVI